MDLVERDGELSILEDLFVSCERGEGKVVVLTGPVASGKTALLQVFGNQVASMGGLYLGAEGSSAESAVPMGLMDQLLRNADLSSVDAEQGVGWLADRALEAAARMPDSVIADSGTSVLCGEWKTLLWKALRHLAEDRPLVIGIDDAHQADLPSLRWLVYFARRVRSAPVLAVFAECDLVQPASSLIRGELLREPHSRHLRVRPLSPAGVRRVLTKRVGRSRAERLVADCCLHSGGNPLLVRAFVEDQRAEQRLGDAFRSAVVGCLHRTDPVMLETARAIAVMEGAGAPHLLADLVAFTEPPVAHAVTALQDAGLLSDGRFRHEVARTAVLDDMAADVRAKCHSRLAELLHNTGAAAALVAEHLVEGTGARTPWSVEVLREAAEDALADEQAVQAIRYLRLAWQHCDERRQRAGITSMLARAEWQVDPLAVARHLPELLDAARDGLLTGRQATEPMTYLLWHGRTEQAMVLFDSLFGGTGAEHVDVGRMWLCCVYLELLQRNPPDESVPLAGRTGHGALTGDLSTMMTCGGADTALVWAEQIVQGFRLGGAGLAPIAAALAVMVQAGRIDRAASWCEELLKAAEARNLVTWHGFLTAVFGLVNLRQGNLKIAQRHTERALEIMPPESWGAAVGVPLAGAVLAATGQGRFEEAAGYLRVPVPKKMFKTPFALLYLRARGKYHLATGDLYVALGDFQACGRLMADWGLDLPALIPWRSDAAEACLRLGKDAEARALVDEQLARLSPEDARTRAISLRVAAATETDPAKRAPILRTVVDILSKAGDPLELAYAFVDLSEAHGALGEHAQARMMARRAHRLARRCDADTIMRSLLPGIRSAEPECADEVATDEERLAKLSFAERKVASLATDGYTNRQIAKVLHVTVSTVEQHLTRVYRKLDVSKRSDLPRSTVGRKIV